MRIRTQLFALVATTALLSIFAIATVFEAARSEAEAAEAQSRAQVIAHEVAGLLTLTQEFARDGETRAAGQWHQRHRAIVAALHSESAQGQAQGGEALAALERAALALPPLFVRLEGLPRTGDGFLERRKAALLDQLLTSTQAMSDYAYQWFQDAATARGRLEDEFRRIAVSVTVLMTLALLSIAATVQRRVLLPLEGLARAAAAVGSGDLGLRLSSTRSDEFGDLSRQFDAMVVALADVRGRIVRSEAQLRAITDNLPAMISYVGPDRRYEFANARYAQWLGLDPAAMIGRRVEEVIDGPYAAVARRNVETALAGARCQWEGSVDGRAGEVFLLAEYIPDLATDGSVRGCYALTIDISERRRAELRVARSEQRLVDLMNNIPAMVGYFDMQERCQYANDTGLRSVGVERGAAPGLALREALGDTTYAQHEPHVREVLQGRRARFEGVIPFRGRSSHFQAHLIPDRVGGADQRGFYLMTFDITALKEARLQQSRTERRLRAITDNLPVLITYVDRDERYGFANQTMQDWLGVDPASAVGKKVADIVPSSCEQARVELLRRALRGERVSFEASSETLGVARCLQTTYIPDIQPDGSVAGVYTLSTDVTAMKNVERQLGLLARSDALTGLPNRCHLNEALPMALARGRRSGLAVGLMFLDVDHFKSINDSLGHAAGDAVLCELASRLRRSVRSTDSVARLAGDEFVVTLEGLHCDTEPETVAEKILALMSQPFDISGARLNVTTSIGIAYHDSSGPEITGAELLAQADAALYEAKRAGRNTFRGSLMAPLGVEAVQV